MATKPWQHLLQDKKQIIHTPEEISKIKVENCIGFVKIPVGIAGPLLVDGPNATNGQVYATLATTEAALIASCARGYKVFNACGGLQFDILGEGMSRVPVFKFPTPRHAINFAKSVPELQSQFTTIAESTSKHLRLQHIVPHIIGSSIHPYISYSCGDASGQNMVTIATQKACQMLVTSPQGSEYEIIGFQIDGNISSDKTPSWGNVRMTRGEEVMAWETLMNSACEKILGTSSYNLYTTLITGKEGGIRNGQFGCNIDTSNIVAAIFIATGQDAACVAEVCWSHLVPEYDFHTKDMKISLYLPSLPVGVIGGGTVYETQNECFQIMKCAGPGMKGRFAGLIASCSHQRLARTSQQHIQKSRM
ncbi:hydroxymethylglutaryl-CoA reductase [Aspergillus tamarii]|uniref:hydroxymethylglutaryl-CoA reductase (NADPH) n=1 Tax=Aspergillus tamarii TaxID=41984 RepID=A0A5N6US56_ASPTM|nr:hydroxymethylglutaryl-CoA reductase [Aspergillus tamarii]